MTKTFLILTLISVSSFASSVCKDAIIKYNLIKGNIITSDDFSSMTFEETKLSDEEYNLLSSEEQFKIYEKVKPLAQKVRETNIGISYMKKDLLDTMRMIAIFGVPEGMTYEDLNKILKFHDIIEALEADMKQCV